MFYSLASANIDQSAPNVVTIHMPMSARMSSIMDQIEPEHPELFALEFGKIVESDFVYTLASTDIDQSAPNLVKMYKTIRSRMSLIMELMGPELSRVICPWIRKFSTFNFVYTLASTSIDQSAPNLVKIYMTIRSGMSSIMDLIRPELFELSALEFENFPYFTLFTL